MHIKRMSLRRCDASRILATVLEQQQTVIQQLIDWSLGNDAEDAAHEESVLSIHNHAQPCATIETVGIQRIVIMPSRSASVELETGRGSGDRRGSLSPKRP